MVTVQLRDAANPDKVLVGPLALPFEPRENKPLYVRDRFDDRGPRFLRGNQPRCYIITDVYRYEVFEHEPERSGIVSASSPLDTGFGFGYYPYRHTGATACAGAGWSSEPTCCAGGGRGSPRSRSPAATTHASSSRGCRRGR